MLERLEKELAVIEQEYQTVNSQKQSLLQGLNQADQRLLQLQGAHERIKKLIDEEKGADEQKKNEAETKTEEAS